MMNSPIKVLHIISSLRQGGAQMCLKTIAENMGGDVEHYVYPLRCSHAEVKIDADIINLPYLHYDLRKFFAIIRLCREYEIDVVHAHLSKPIVGALLARPRIDIPVVIHQHSSVFDRRSSFPGYTFFMRRLWRRADAVIAVSSMAAGLMTARMGIPRDRIDVIHNGVDFSRFNSSVYGREECRGSLGLAAGDIVIGFAGRLDGIKGADLAVGAMAHLLKKSERFVLVLAGDGSERKNLEALAERLKVSRRVVFLGYREDIPRVMAACDIGVVPSRNEALGITGLEFMQMNRPVVCSGVDGMAEYAENEKTALIPAEKTAEGFAGAISRLADDERLRDALVRAAAEKVNGFSMEAQLDKTRGLYYRVLGLSG